MKDVGLCAGALLQNVDWHSAQFEKNQKCLTIAKEKECEGEITNYLVVSKKGRLANMQID
jgi:hypothetical protein